MSYGICNLGIVPVRKEPSHRAEMINQLLFGEHFTVLETDKNWSKISLDFDNFEGYVNNLQFQKISKTTYLNLLETENIFSNEIIDFISSEDQNLTTIPLGASLPFFSKGILSVNETKYNFEGKTTFGQLSKREIIRNAFIYLNTPYLWGGRTPFGIDSSGFTQMVYKLSGYSLPREVKEQANQGEVLSFIEESETGDLAFFDDEEGDIIHVGIILNDYNIIHVHGKVRIDTLDHSGIFNSDLQTHTHKLRIIKKFI